MKTLLSEENGCYVIESLKKEGVLAAFSSRKWNLKLDQSESPTNSEAHKSFCRALDIDANHLICLDQVHGTGIVLLGDGPPGDRPSSKTVSPVPDLARKIPKTDAAVTRTAGLAFAIHTADCSPVFFFDPESRSVGLAHIGWKGAAQGLAEKMVQVFRMNFRTQAANLKVIIGPMIGECCYEVGSEFHQYFPEFIREIEGKQYCDLKGFIKHQLMEEGLLACNLTDTELCTVCENEQFFSYRREREASGRMCSVMMIQP